MTSNLGGNLAASSDYTTWETFLDVSSYVGTVLDVDYHPVYEILLLEASVSSTGIQAEFRITEYNAADVGTATTAIVFGGTPPTAEFTATPKTGANPLSVQFTFTGDEAVGLPTTYSWKRRKTDSGDAFVEFPLGRREGHRPGIGRHQLSCRQGDLAGDVAPDLGLDWHIGRLEVFILEVEVVDLGGVGDADDRLALLVGLGLLAEFG